MVQLYRIAADRSAPFCRPPYWPHSHSLIAPRWWRWGCCGWVVAS